MATASSHQSKVDEFGDPLPEFNKPEWKCYLCKSSNDGNYIVVYLRNDGVKKNGQGKTQIYLSIHGSSYYRKAIGAAIADMCSEFELDPEYFNWKDKKFIVEEFKRRHNGQSPWWATY